MSDVFDLTQSTWSYDARVPDVLRATRLPLDAPAQRKSEREAPAGCFAASRHDAAWWDAAMAGQDFSAEDRLDTPKFNSALWAGLRGEESVAPDRPAADLRAGRSEMLAAWRKGARV
jgi:hypothetical protein